MIINLAKIRFGGSGGGTSPAKPEDFFQETYTANGNYDVAPQAGHVFSGGQIEVNVQPRLQTKEATPLTLAQTVSPDAGYDGLQSVTVTGVTSEIDSNITADNIKKDVTILGVTGTLESGITPTGTININANGTYDVTDKATAVVAVGGTDYRYKTGTPDTIGLTAIGWDADSIGYYGANAPHYAWENDNYKVSQKNIDLYNLDDPNPSLYKNDPEVTFVPNKKMKSYFEYQGFEDMKYIKSIPWYDTSSMERFARWFYGCTSLQTIPPLDTSKATSMSQIFNDCSSLTSVPSLNTSNVTDMWNMFRGCSSLTSVPPLNTSNVTKMEQMFYECSSLTSVPPLDASKASSLENMFFGCRNLKTIPSLNTSGVTNMRYMFNECRNLKTIPALNTSSVTNMNYMFQNCSSLQTIPVLDTSNVTNMEHMFYYCLGLTSVSFTDTSKVTNMNYMFYNCPALKRIESIDFSSLTSYPNSFFYSSKDATHIIVNGKINFSWDDYYGFYYTPNLDFDSIKSILEAMNRTDNTNAKIMKFNQAIIDRDGELAGLVSSCATKGWTIQGLTIKTQSMINSITPSSDHIHMSDISNPGVTLTVNANEAWVGGGRPGDHVTSNRFYLDYDYYNATTDELTRTGSKSSSGMSFSPESGSAGVTTVKVPVNYVRYYLKPRSGEYALVGITFKTASSPYEYVDYYFKVYPNGE